MPPAAACRRAPRLHLILRAELNLNHFPASQRYPIVLRTLGDGVSCSQSACTMACAFRRGAPAVILQGSCREGETRTNQPDRRDPTRPSPRGVQSDTTGMVHMTQDYMEHTHAGGRAYHPERKPHLSSSHPTSSTRQVPTGATRHPARGAQNRDRIFFVWHGTSLTAGGFVIATLPHHCRQVHRQLGRRFGQHAQSPIALRNHRK